MSGTQAEPSGTERGNVDSGQNPNYSDPVHGTDSEGNDVTAQFGREGGPAEGHTLLSDGHKSDSDFMSRGEDGVKGHDYYDGQGGGTERGQYTGEGS